MGTQGKEIRERARDLPFDRICLSAGACGEEQEVGRLAGIVCRIADQGYSRFDHPVQEGTPSLTLVLPWTKKC